MRDEHLIYTDLADGKIKIVPAEGYRMFCIIRKQYLSEAVVSEKDIKYFASDPIG